MNQFEIAEMIIEMGKQLIKEQQGNVSPTEYRELQVKFDQTMLIANKVIKAKNEEG